VSALIGSLPTHWVRIINIHDVCDAWALVPLNIEKLDFHLKVKVSNVVNLRQVNRVVTARCTVCIEPYFPAYSCMGTVTSAAVRLVGVCPRYK